MKNNIGIINVGIGNVQSIKNMLYACESDSDIINKPEELSNYRKIILPGVGSYDSFIDNKIIGKKLIDKVINSKNASKIFWKSDVLISDKANVRPDEETVEVNYLANFLGIKMSEDFYTENGKIFSPIVRYFFI